MRESNAASTPETPEDLFVAEIVQGVSEKVRRGESVDLNVLLAEHPQHAARLKRLLPTIEALAAIDESSPGAAESPSGRGGCSRIGEYQIVREIAHGGMGIVYEARQVALNRRVALKVLPFAAALDPRALARFKQESLAAAQLDHPHIVPVYGVGVDRGIHYYAMRYIEGQSLAQLIAEMKGPDSPFDGEGQPSAVANPVEAVEMSMDQSCPPAGDSNGELVSDSLINDPDATRVFPPFAEEGQEGACDREFAANSRRAAHGLGATSPSTNPQSAIRSPKSGSTLAQLAAGSSTDRVGNHKEFFRGVARLAIQAAEALDYAHQHGVLHRDVKPGNLLLDEGGKVYITDFGLARVESETNLTRTGDLMGTLRYMSPEQAAAARGLVDQRSDVYSLGAALYELLTLRPVFTAEDRALLVKQIAEDDPAPLRKLNRSIPDELETILLKCLEKEPVRRYATTQALADDLQRFLENKPITARPPSLGNRAAKWARRNKPLMRAALALLVLSVLVLAASTAWVLRAKQESDINAAKARDAEGERRLQAEQAQANLHSAVETVSKLLTNVSEEMLFETPGATKVRRKILGDAAEQLDILCKNQNDPQLLLRAASAFRQLATIHNQLGEMELSLAPLSRADELLSESAAGPASAIPAPERQIVDLSIKYERAHAYWYLHRLGEAETEIELGLNAARAIQKRGSIPDSRKWLARGLQSRGQIRMSQGRFDLAQSDFLEALGIIRTCLDEPCEIGPTILRLRRRECHLLTDLGIARRLAGDSAVAVEALQNACSLALDLDVQISRYPDDGVEDSAHSSLPFSRQCRWNDAQAHCELGQVYLGDLDYSNARPAFERAVTLLESLTAEYPDVFWTRMQRVVALIGLALSCDPEHATPYLQQASRIRTSLPKRAAPGFHDRQIAWLIVVSGRNDIYTESAVEFAERAVGAHRNARTLTTLGAALYRARRFADAVEALLESEGLTQKEGDGSAYNGFILAMAQWQLGAKQESRKWYDRAVERNRKQSPKPREVTRFQKEAGDLLGIPVNGAHESSE